jgi:hypothetical protein
MCEDKNWICREWGFDATIPNCLEQDIKRLNLMKKYSNYLNPKTYVSYNEKGVKICQKRILHRSLEDVKGNKTAYEIVKKLTKLISLNIVHGDLCASNIGFDNHGELLIFDWEPFLKINKPNSNLIELRSSKYALHPKDQTLKCITSRSDLFATGSLLLQALYGRYQGLNLMKQNTNLISKFSENTANPTLGIQKMFKFAKELKYLK